MLGAKVREVSLPHTALSIVCYYILADSDVASNLARFDGVRFGHRTGFKATESFNEMLAESRTESLGETVRRRIFAGNFYTME
jgi:aspartyl-tRNA(Asn)/glutamyl-tRNA(Gln) amidotransferase subunit A